MRILSVFRTFAGIILFCVFLSPATGCSKESNSYDPSGKCGSAMSWEVTNIGTWKVRLSMDDGATYYTYLTYAPTLGARFCF